MGWRFTKVRSIYTKSRLMKTNETKAQRFNVGALIAVRYNMSALELRTGFFRLLAKNPTYEKMALRAPERRREVIGA